MTDTLDIQPGDVVRVGKGKKLWTVDSFWPGHPEGTTLARLNPVEGYTATSVDLVRLTLIERRVDTRPPGTQEQPC